MNRRRFLRNFRTVTVLVAGGGIWYTYGEGAFSQGKVPAFEPWRDWNKPQTGILALVRAAILAASPHNSQPWLFRVTKNENDRPDKNKYEDIVDFMPKSTIVGVPIA